MKQILLGLFTLLFLATSCLPKAPEYRSCSGIIFGTYYKVNYKASEDLQSGMVAAMRQIDASLSTFNEASTISRINRNDSAVVLDSLFLEVIHTAQEVSEQTDGAFDMTVAPLVNSWGFGFDPQKTRTPAQIDSLLQCVGYEKVHIEGDRLYKDDARIQLDASAIAKGLGCDLVAQYLHSQGVEDFLVDIGGEMVIAGHSPAHKDWRIGIQYPTEDSLQISNKISAILQLDGAAVATSGNYRQFYYQDGRKVAHTIDPRTGYPAAQNLLSVTVLGPSAMVADAYATAFMVLSDSVQIKEIATKNGLGIFLTYSEGLTITGKDSVTTVSNAALRQYIVTR